MSQKKLFSARELHAARKNKACIVVDCRFALGDPGSGYSDYLQTHIPGAVYAHLDNDLSSPVTSSSGRHPLPDADKFAAFLAQSGWQPGLTLVAYDHSVLSTVEVIESLGGHDMILADVRAKRFKTVCGFME